jgi:V/A-type H+/Na+-transporting ATPase subunit E
MENTDIPDVQLKELIDTIHRDGVDKARLESETLLRQAQAQAGEIVAVAQAQAAALLANARQEREQLDHSGRESLKQASRDLLLGIRKQLEDLFSALLKEKTLNVLKEEEITAAIVAMISKWTPERQDRLELLLPQKQFDSLAQALRKAMAGKVAAGVEIKAAPEVVNGFRVAEKDGQAYYDFSAESIAESLALSLNPVMAKIVADALHQDG